MGHNYPQRNYGTFPLAKFYLQATGNAGQDVPVAGMGSQYALGRCFCGGVRGGGRYWPAHNLFMFFLQIAALLPLIPIALLLTFRRELVSYTREWCRRRRPSAGLSHEYQTSTTTIG